MPDAQKKDTKLADQEQKDEPRPFHLEGSQVVFEKPKSEEKISRETRYREQHEFAREQVKTNKRLAWFTGLLVLGTFVGTCISLWQASISQAAANAAQSAAKTAYETLGEMKNGATDTHTLVMAEKTQADASRDIAAASKRQAEISASVQRSSERIEAADIEIESTVCSTYPGPLTVDSEIRYFWKNTGHSAASKVRMIMHIGRYGSDPVASGYSEQGSVLGPGVAISTFPLKVGTGISDVDLKAINAKRPNALPLHVWGWVSYEDRFGRKHLMVHDATYVANSPCDFSPVKVVAIP